MSGAAPEPSAPSAAAGGTPFDAIIAIGVLIKGDTVHFEHIAESVSRGLMRVQLDFGVRTRPTGLYDSSQLANTLGYCRYQ